MVDCFIQRERDSDDDSGDDDGDKASKDQHDVIAQSLVQRDTGIRNNAN